MGSLAGLSMMGSGIIILTALLFKPLRTHPYSLVMWLSICDFFFSLKYVVAAIYPNSFSLNLIGLYCQISGLYTNFFALASISWSAVLSVNLILNTVRPFGDTSSYTGWFHFFVWSISGISTLLVGLSKDIGISADGTCWFEVSEKFHWQFFVPLITYFLLALGATIFSTIRTWNFSHGATRYAVKLLVRMILYVLVFLGAWLGPTVHELIVTVNGVKKHRNQPPSAPSTSPFAPSAPGTPFTPMAAPIPTAFVGTFAEPNHPLAPVIQSPEGFNTDSPLTWWTGVSVALVGFLNAAIWLSNPAIYKLLKNRVILRYCSCWYNRAERIPLISKLESMLLEDQDSDVHRLNTVFRNNALACLLLGIRYSLTQISGSKPGLSESLKYDAALMRAGRPARDLGPKRVSLKQPMAQPVAHAALDKDELIPLDDDDTIVGVTDAWAVQKEGEYPPQAIPAVLAKSNTQTARITNVEDLPNVVDRPSRGLSGLFELPPPTLDGFEPDDSVHILSNNDFDFIEKMDLSPENLEELDVPDLFTSPFHFHDYAPHVFHNIRLLFGFESQEYYQSLAPAEFMNSVLENANFSGGRSGSFMCFSPDRRFLIKTIPEHEARTMVRILPAYYAHIRNNPKTLLTPVVGLYALRLVGAPPLSIIVMANLFSTDYLTPSLVYDLKGSWVDRGGKTTRGTRKDNDLRTAFQVSFSDAASLHKQLAADSKMLAEQGVMDYSLLVGVRDLSRNVSSNSYVPPRRKKDLRTSSNASTASSSNRSISDSVNSSLVEYDSVQSPSPRPPSFHQDRHAAMRTMASQRKRALSEASQLSEDETDEEEEKRRPDDEEKARLSTDDDITFESNRETSFNLYANHGGPQNKTGHVRVITSPDQNQLYVVGIIDILQSYNFSKRVERFFKVYFRCKSKTGLSSTNPIIYQERFCKAMARNLGLPRDNDDFA